MCGFTVLIGSNRPPDDRLERALDLMVHRGPDARGTWSDGHAWLGSRRLSILDRRPAGDMPMQFGSLQIVHNGEIYNYVELREALEALGHTFGTGTDTEVVLHAYAEWGPGCVERFNGMWAFAIWDARARELFLSRDRFGVKPLYLAMSSGRLLAASEPKAIVDLDPSLRRVDDRTLFDLLVEKRLDVTERSFYRGVSVLPPGHNATYRPHDPAPAIRRWWDLATQPEPSVLAGTDVEIAEEFGRLFDDAVRLRFRSDVPVGITLSGGLDSTAVLAASVRVRESDEALWAFTSVYGDEDSGMDERRWARRAAGRYGDVRLEEVGARSEQWLEDLRRICWHMDGPGFSPAVFPLWRIMSRARSAGVPVLLEGQGADEQLGGYPQHSAHAVLDALTQHGRRRTAPAVAHAAVRSHGARRTAVETTLAAVPRLRALQRRRAGVETAIRDDWVRQIEYQPSMRDGSGSAPALPSSLEARLRRDFDYALLPGFLHYGDAISMAHSIETRLPFLDHRLVSFLAVLPGEQKIGGGETKRVLRSYLRRQEQDEIAARLDKRGYPTPANEWLAEDDGRVLRETLLGPTALIRDFLRPDGIARLIERHVRGRLSGADQLYALLATELWLQQSF